MPTPNFEQFCRDIIGEPISKAWQVFYAAVEGLPLDEEGVELFRRSTGRERYEPRVYVEATGICGRRSEKTSSALKFLIWKSLFAGWERQGSWLRRATRGKPLRIPLIAQDMRVVKDILRTAQALVTESAVVSAEVDDIRVNEIAFRNGVSLICLPASKASVRGLTCPAGLLDELAWTEIEGASDKELCRQVRPAMIQFGQARRLIKLSTPWRSSGDVISTEYAERAERTDLLVWQASTQTMTPRIAVADLERERIADPAYYRREFLAEFTSDLEAFIPGGDIDAAIGNWHELPFVKGNFYVAALDASSLSGKDNFTFGICHSEKSGAIVDVLRAWSREAVPHVCDEIVLLCKQYGIANVTADQYSFTFLAELLRQRGIGMEQLAFTARSKPEIFFDLKSFLAQGTFHLPQHDEAVRELRALESTRLSGGSYRIGAPKGMHDDYCATLALLANKVKRSVAKEPWSVYLIAGDPKTALGQNAPRPSPYRVTNDRWANLGPNDCGPERWWHHI